MNGNAKAKPCLLLPAQCLFYDMYCLCPLGLHLFCLSLSGPAPSSQALSLEKSKRVREFSLGRPVHFWVSAHMCQMRDWFSRRTLPTKCCSWYLANRQHRELVKSVEPEFDFLGSNLCLSFLIWKMIVSFLLYRALVKIKCITVFKCLE